MTTQSLILLVSTFFFQAPVGELHKGAKVEQKVADLRPLLTHVETWCYASARCTGSPVKNVPLSQCKGEHQGVRLVVVYDATGKVKKRGPCISGDLLAPL